MTNNTNNKPSLTAVAAQLSTWRDNRAAGNNKIPDLVWDNIFELAKEYPRGVICKQLGISGSQFTKNLKKLGSLGQIYSAPVALCQVPASSPKNISASKEINIPSPLQTLIVEYVRSDGLVMKIHTTNMALLDLIQTFLRLIPMLQITFEQNIFIATKAIDFRNGIDGIIAICRQILKNDPFSGHVFIFRNRLLTSVKVLTYDGKGFWLYQS